MELNIQPCSSQRKESDDLSKSDSDSINSFKDQRLKTIEDIRKKFKSQHKGSLKKISPNQAAKFQESQFSSNDPQSHSASKKMLKFQEKYNVLEIIGQGSTSVVKKIENIETKKIYATKIIRTRDQELLDFLRNEHLILAKLQHKNIIQSEEIIVDNDMGTAYIILEYAPGKTLQQLIIEKTKIDEQTMRGIVEQLVSAIKYLHEKGVSHRDVTPSNIIVSETNEVKLVDFSIAKIFRAELWSPSMKIVPSIRKRSSPLIPSYPGMMLTDSGTPAYKAPEIIFGIPYNQSIDMWAVGVVTYYALAGYKPFNSQYLEKLYKRIGSAKFKWDPLVWQDISFEAGLFVQSCLKKYSFIRLSAKEAVQHPWIRGIKLRDEKVENKHLRRSMSEHISLISKDSAMKSQIKQMSDIFI